MRVKFQLSIAVCRKRRDVHRRSLNANVSPVRQHEPCSNLVRWRGWSAGRCLQSSRTACSGSPCPYWACGDAVRTLRCWWTTSSKDFYASPPPPSAHAIAPSPPDNGTAYTHQFVYNLMWIRVVLCVLTVKTLDLQSWGGWFDSLSGCYQVVITWMGNSLQRNKPSMHRAYNEHQDQLSLPSLHGR